MATTRHMAVPQQLNRNHSFQYVYNKLLSIIHVGVVYVHHVLTDISYINHLLVALLVFDSILSTLIIQYIPYTEIDWSTYIQQLDIFMKHGETNYINITGSTGPLVYPAFHLYIYTILSYITDNGTNIRYAQYIFQLIYIVFTLVVCLTYKNAMAAYNKQNKSMVWRIPPYILIPLVLSKRIHSIFVLRLFNDCIAMLLLHVSILLFQGDQWATGCIVYSLGVGTKMNVLLFAPALLYLLLQRYNILNTIKYLLLCGTVQLIIGSPFLLTHPISYLTKAFELSRQFFYIWTVNWKFLPEPVFLSQSLSIVLLLAHIVIMLYLLHKMVPSGLMNTVQCSIQGNNDTAPSSTPNSFHILVLMYVTNFIGVVFARSLHYQFYVWYYHTLPLILYITQYYQIIQIILLLCVEYCWNVFPATPYSSGLLFMSHGTILIGLLRAFKNTNINQFVNKLQTPQISTIAVSYKTE